MYSCAFVMDVMNRPRREDCVPPTISVGITMAGTSTMARFGHAPSTLMGAKCLAVSYFRDAVMVCATSTTGAGRYAVAPRITASWPVPAVSARPRCCGRSTRTGTSRCAMTRPTPRGSASTASSWRTILGGRLSPMRSFTTATGSATTTASKISSCASTYIREASAWMTLSSSPVWCSNGTADA